jgi:hypothetical protein
MAANGSTLKFSLDLNQLFQDALNALQGGRAPFWVVVVLVTLIMSPWLIPAISRAIAEQRSLSYKHEENLLKIRSSAGERTQGRRQLAPPSSGSKRA